MSNENELADYYVPNELHSDEFYMLVRQGKVQRMPASTADDANAQVWPIARTHADALRLAKWFHKTNPSAHNSKVRPALIGSIKGETLEGHITLALKEGCIGTACVAGWLRDGSPEWGWLPFD